MYTGWEFIVLTVSVLFLMGSLIVGATIGEWLTAEKMKACVEQKMQWVEKNCIYSSTTTTTTPNGGVK